MQALLGGLLIVAFLGLMFAQGLNISPREVALACRRRPGLLVRSLLAVDVLVPAAFVFVIWLLRPALDFYVGLTVIAACPLDPLTIARVPGSGGRFAYAASLHALLAPLSIVTVPITLAILSRALGFTVHVRIAALVQQIVFSLVVPLGVGIFVRQLSPGLAARISVPLSKVAGLLLLMVLIVAFILFASLLTHPDLRSYLTMIAAVSVALGIGHLLGGPVPEDRVTLALESASRNPGLAFVIGELNYPRETIAPVLGPYLVVFIIVSSFYVGWRRHVRLAGTRRVQA